MSLGSWQSAAACFVGLFSSPCLCIVLARRVRSKIMCGFVHVVCRAWIATRFYYFIFFLLRFCDVLYFLECCGLRQWIGKRFGGLFSCVWHVRLMSTTDANFVVLGSCTACPTCSSGQYRSGCSGTNSSGSCASCTNTLQSGQYYTGSGGTNQSGCGVGAGR